MTYKPKKTSPTSQKPVSDANIKIIQVITILKNTQCSYGDEEKISILKKHLCYLSCFEYIPQTHYSYFEGI